MSEGRLPKSLLNISAISLVLTGTEPSGTFWYRVTVSQTQWKIKTLVFHFVSLQKVDTAGVEVPRTVFCDSSLREYKSVFPPVPQYSSTVQQSWILLMQEDRMLTDITIHVDWNFANKKILVDREKKWQKHKHKWTTRLFFPPWNKVKPQSPCNLRNPSTALPHLLYLKPQNPQLFNSILCCNFHWTIWPISPQHVTWPLAATWLTNLQNI